MVVRYGLKAPNFLPIIISIDNLSRKNHDVKMGLAVALTAPSDIWMGVLVRIISVESALPFLFTRQGGTN